MVKICRCLADNKAQEGFRNGAWSILLKSHSTEKDDRVLEALKVGQVQNVSDSTVIFFFVHIKIKASIYFTYILLYGLEK